MNQTSRLARLLVSGFTLFLLVVGLAQPAQSQSTQPVCGQVAWAVACPGTGIAGMNPVFVACDTGQVSFWAPTEFTPNAHYRVSDPVFEEIDPTCTNEYGDVTSRLVSWSRYEPIDSCAVCVTETDPAPIGPESVWHSAGDVFGKLQDCWGGSQDIGECLVSIMQESDASPEAIAFTESIQRDGFMSEFWEMGTVDLAFVTYPFRANDNFQPMLVNGTPQLVPVDDWDLVKQVDVREDRLYPSLARKYPDLMIWVGDNRFENVEPLPPGGQRFIFSFKLVNGCHACEVGGFAHIAFDFDRMGQFSGRKLILIEGVVDPDEARSWLDEKASLIPDLESVDIPTSLFTVPGIQAYDETAARDLTRRIETQLEQGTLTSEQLEAFARLTVQERGLSEMLPAYTEVSASLTDTYADSIEVALGVVFILKPAWNVCRKGMPFCGRLQEATEGTMWRLIRDTGKLAARVIGSDPDQRETGAKVWDLTVRLVEDKFAQGQSLQDLLVDNAVQAAGTTVMIGPYLKRTQALLDKGVRTADIDSDTADRWPITGDTQRAGLHVDGLIDLADLESEDALSRHQDFQEAADIARLAEDIADLGTLSPWAAISQAVALGARIEHLFIVNLPLIFLTQDNLQCVEYLSARSAELAFDSDQPGESCKYRDEAHLIQRQGPTFVTHQPSPPLRHPLQAQVQSEAEQYRQAVEALVDAIQTQDLHAIEQAIDQLTQAEAVLANTLTEVQAVLLAQEALDENDLALLEQSNALTARNFALYLAIAETLVARQAGHQPQAELPAIAQAALSAADDVQQTADQLDLAPPAGQPVLVIRKVAAEATSDQQLHLDVGISNAGAGEAVGVQVALLVEGEPAGQTTDLGTLPAGAETRATLDVTAPPDATFTVQVWSQDQLMDTHLGSVPAPVVAATVSPESDMVTAVPTAMLSETPTAATPAPSQQPSPVCGGALGFLIFPLLALVWHRRSRRSNP